MATRIYRDRIYVVNSDHDVSTVVFKEDAERIAIFHGLNDNARKSYFWGLGMMIAGFLFFLLSLFVMPV